MRERSVREIVSERLSSAVDAYSSAFEQSEDELFSSKVVVKVAREAFKSGVEWVLLFYGADEQNNEKGTFDDAAKAASYPKIERRDDGKL